MEMRFFKTSGRSGSEAGMTLIELLVVISIMVISAGVIFPVWSRYYRNQEIKAEAGKIADDFRLARNKAINNEQAEFTGSQDYVIEGYYIYIDNPPLSGSGNTTYYLKRVIRNKTTGVYVPASDPQTLFESSILLSDVKIYRGQNEIVDSVYFKLPFGKLTFYRHEPSDSTAVEVNSQTGCPAETNSDACSVYYLKKDNVDNYYFKLIITKEGTILLEKEG